MNEIPSLDLSKFIQGSIEEKQQFVQEIGRAYEEIGFASISGHFLSEDLMNSLYTEVKAFFDLPETTKEQYEIEGMGGQRGYTSFGKEHAKDSNHGDLKEFWHFGQYVPEEEEAKFNYPKNVEVKELPNFNSVGKECYQALEKTGIYVLRSLALFLGLDEYYFDDKVRNGNSILRPIHYPPITSDPGDAVRAGAHGDINLITLLMGASAGGLQVLRHDGAWIDAKPNENELVINVGDMLSRLTNNQLKSTIHRVVNPPKEQWHQPRYSIPFFMHPISEMDLNCLPECTSHDHPKQYEDITAGAFLEQRLREIGLIK